jgi:hypothetical protein
MAAHCKTAQRETAQQRNSDAATTYDRTTTELGAPVRKNLEQGAPALSTKDPDVPTSMELGNPVQAWNGCQDGHDE